MNPLIISLTLLTAVALTRAHWTYIAIAGVVVIALNTVLIRWALKQIRTEPDGESDALANLGASNAIGETAAARSTVGVPRTRSLRPRDQAENAAPVPASARAEDEMPALAGVIAGGQERAAFKEGSPVPGSGLPSYQPIMPFSPGAAEIDPSPAMAKGAGATVTTPPAVSLSTLAPALETHQPDSSPSPSLGIPGGAVGAETPPTPAAPPSDLPDASLTHSAPAGTEPSSESAMPSASAWSGEKDLDAAIAIPDMSETPEPVPSSRREETGTPLTPRTFLRPSPAPEPEESSAAAPPAPATAALPGLVLPDLIPSQPDATPEKPVFSAAVPAAVPAPAEEPESEPLVAEQSIPLTSAPSLLPAPPAEASTDLPPEPARPSGQSRVFLPSTFASQALESSVESPAREPEPTSSARIFMPAKFESAPAETPAPLTHPELVEEIPAAPNTSQGPLTGVEVPSDIAAPASTTEEAASQPSTPDSGLSEVPESVSDKDTETGEPVAPSETSPPFYSEDVRLEALQSIAKDPAEVLPSEVVPAPAAEETPSLEEDRGHLVSASTDGEESLTPESTDTHEAAQSVSETEPARGIPDPAEASNTEPAPAQEAFAPSFPFAPEEVPAFVEAHDLPMTIAAPESVPTSTVQEATAARFDGGSSDAETPDSIEPSPVLAMPLAEAPGEVSTSTSQTAAAPAEVAPTSTPRTTMTTTDSTSSQAAGGRASAQLTLGFEVTSLQLTPFFKLGAVQLRSLSNVVSLHLITTGQAENPLAAGISFQIDTVELNESAHIRSILLKPLGQAQAAATPQPKLQVDNVQLGQGGEGAPIQVTSSQGTSTAVQLLATCTIAAMDFTPAFEIGSLRLEPTSNTVLLRSAPSQRPAALDLPPSFEVANVQLEGSAQLATVRLTPNGAK